jgi:hypothetical protein
MSALRRLPVRLPVTVRRVLARRPWIYWAVVASAVIATMATVLERVEQIDAARDAWGEAQQVLVASADVAPGEPLAVITREVPTAIVPQGALAADGSVDHVARQHVLAGEIVTEADVGPADASGPLALVPPGWLAVAIVESPASGAEVGDRVQVAADGVVLSAEAVVVGYHDDATLVAVPEEVAPVLPPGAEAGGLALLLQP